MTQFDQFWSWSENHNSNVVLEINAIQAKSYLQEHHNQMRQVVHIKLRELHEMDSALYVELSFICCFHLYSYIATLVVTQRDCCDTFFWAE